MNRTLLLGGAAAAVVLTTAGLSAVATAGGSPQGPAGAPPVARSSDPTVTKCDGGAQKQVLTRIRSTPSTFGEGAAFDVPGGKVTVKGPKKGTDTLLITFSGEANLFGSTDADERYDWMGIEVHVDGVPIQPYTASGDVYAFTGPGGYFSNAAQFCTKIGKGKHDVQVKLNLVDQSNADSLTGWIDDHTLSVERSE